MITAVLALAMLEPQVHQTDPPAVFRATVDLRIGARCYRIPSPQGTEAMFCDVLSPATGQAFVVSFISQGGTAIQKAK